jgi:hypothetical protein
MVVPGKVRSHEMATSAMARKTNASEKKTQQSVLHMPEVHVPRVPVPRIYTPTGKAGRVLWWGELAAVVAGVVDWPVAALVAAGSWVGEQYIKTGRRPAPEREADH